MKKLFIYGLSKKTSASGLAAWAGFFGNVMSVNIAQKNGLPANYAFLEMENDERAEALLADKNHQILDGRHLQVSFAKQNPSKQDQYHTADEPKHRRPRLHLKR